MAEAEHINAEALAGGEEGDVLVADIDGRAGLHLIAINSVRDGRILRAKPDFHLPIGNRRLKKTLELDAR